MKRISVILLSLCILCGSMPLSAGAEEVYQEPAFSDEELEDIVLEDQGGSQDLTDILIDEDLIFLEDDLPDWDLVPEELPEEMLLLTEELIEQEELLSAPDNWSLPLVNGGTLTNKTYADKVQLIYFLGDYSDHAYLKDVAKAKWAGNEKLKIIAVCDTDSKADALALSKSLTPGSSGITYAYDGSFLKWSIWSSFHPNTGVGDMGMIIQNGKIAEVWDIPYAPTAAEPLSRYLDLGSPSFLWSLHTADNTVIDQDSFPGKVQLFIFFYSDDPDILYTTCLDEISASVWARNPALQIIAVNTANNPEATKAYRNTYSPGSGSIIFTYDDYALVCSLHSKFGLSGNIADTGAVLVNGVPVDVWQGNDSSKQTVAHLSKFIDLGLANEFEVGLDVSAPSQAEIIEFADSHARITSPDTYALEPAFQEPWRAGALSSMTLQSTINTLNLLRFIAGLNADVTLNAEYNQFSAAAAYVNYLNGSMSHNPARPAVLGSSSYTTLYEQGRTGAQRSNLGMGYSSTYEALVSGWISDSAGESNRACVGHRRWVLYPGMKMAGFGSAGGHTAMYAHDNSGSHDSSRVGWPAQNTPVQFFRADWPWSLSLDVSFDTASVAVSLKRQSDGKIWNFSSNGSDGEFHINTVSYGQNSCIIFCPAGLEGISPGENFDVSVHLVCNDGTKLHIAYTVCFFDMGDAGIVGGSSGAVLITQDIIDYVNRCYRIILGRDGESAGVYGWARELAANHFAGAEIVSQFVMSDEFLGKKPDNSEVVTTLYRSMLNREPDTGGLKGWVSNLEKGASYNMIINGFAGSAEFLGICSRYGITAGSVDLEPRDMNLEVTAFVSRCYRYALGRAGDAGGLNHWASILLNRVMTPQAVSFEFLNSAEFKSMKLSDRDYISTLYRLYMDRNADKGGMDYWLGQLKSGVSRETAAQGFAGSPEFTGIVKSYGLG